jgi:AcrR family transcriptional regulator
MALLEACMDRNDIQDFEILGNKYPLPFGSNRSGTKAKILLEATILFAKKGYAGVSIRDISDKVGISPGALYNHYDSKVTLWKEIASQTEALYRLYFDELDKNVRDLDTFEEALELILHEPRMMRNVFTCYAFEIIQNEKLHDPEAARIYLDVFYGYGVEMMRDWFDWFITKGKVKPFDTRAVSVILISLVLKAVSVWNLLELGRAKQKDLNNILDSAESLILGLTAE